MVNLTKADAILWASKPHWTKQAAAALIQGIAPESLEAGRAGVHQARSNSHEYLSRQSKLDEMVRQVATVMKIFESNPPAGQTPFDWMNHAKRLKLDVHPILESHIRPKVGAGDTADVCNDWQTGCRTIADELHAKDVAAGAWSSVSDIADRVAPIAVERKIRGPQGQLTAGNILRESLQGKKWNKGRNKS